MFDWAGPKTASCPCLPVLPRTNCCARLNTLSQPCNSSRAPAANGNVQPESVDCALPTMGSYVPPLQGLAPGLVGLYFANWTVGPLLIASYAFSFLAPVQ